MDSRPPDAPRFWGRAPQRGQGGLWSLVQMALRTGPAPLGSVKLGSWSVLPGPALAAPQEVGCHPSGRKGGEDGAMCSENHLQRRQPSTGCWHPASVGTGRGPGRQGDLPSVCLAGPVCVQDCGLRGPSGLRPPGRALADGRGHGACAPRSSSPRWLPVDRRSSPQPWSLP